MGEARSSLDLKLMILEVGWWEAEFRSRYWRRTVGEARSSLDLKLMVLDRNQDIEFRSECPCAQGFNTGSAKFLGGVFK